MLPLKDTSSPSPPFAQGTNFVMEIGVTTTCVEGAAARLGPLPLAGSVTSSWQPSEDKAKAAVTMRLRYVVCMVPPGGRGNWAHDANGSAVRLGRKRPMCTRSQQ